MRRLLILAAAVALVAGCGNGGTKQAASSGGGASGAAVAPRSAAFFVELDTSFDSAQWEAFQTLLRKFPDGDKLFSSIGGDNTSLEDLKAALGSETDVVAMTADDADKNVFVGLTQPDDPAKLDTLLAKDTTPSVSEPIEDWRAIADDRATLDRFKQARNGGTLADDPSYKDAASSLPADALAGIYIDGAVLTKAIDQQAKTGTGPVPGVGRIGWVAGALSAKAQGFLLDLRIKGDEIEATPFTAELPSEVPADVSLFLDFKGLNSFLDELKRNPAVEKQLGSAQQALGGLLDEVIGLFAGEGAVYVRPGGGKSEYTLVLKVADETKAKASLDKLATLVGALAQKAPEPVRVGRVSAQLIALGDSGDLYYAVFDGKLVVTNGAGGITGLSSSQHLADSQGWRDATAAAEIPDQTAGILYADVQELVRLGKSMSSDSNPITPEVERNATPLRTALIYGSIDGDIVSIKGFVSVR